MLPMDCNGSLQHSCAGYQGMSTMFAALVHCRKRCLQGVLGLAAPIWGACPSDNGSMHSNVSVPHSAAVSCRASGSSFTATVGSCRASGSSFAATVIAPLRHCTSEGYRNALQITCMTLDANPAAAYAALSLVFALIHSARPATGSSPLDTCSMHSMSAARSSPCHGPSRPLSCPRQMSSWKLVLQQLAA